MAKDVPALLSDSAQDYASDELLEIMTFGATNPGDSSPMDGRSQDDERQSHHQQQESPSDKRVEQVTQLFAQQNFHDVPLSRLQEMSPEERAEAFYELHGVLDYANKNAAFTRKDSSEWLASKLEKMDQLVQQKDATAIYAYELARRQNPSYVQGMKSLFLHAEQNDVVAAANRMAEHFASKLKIFEGRIEVLGRDILLEDFDRDEREKILINAGFFQIARKPDSVGRPLVLAFPGAISRTEAYHFPSVMRGLWWAFQTVARMGEEVQRKGAILLFCAMDFSPSDNIDNRSQAYFEIFEKVPIRVCGVHAFTNVPAFKTVFDACALFGKSKYVTRFQTYLGSFQSCLSNLATFGIPKDIFPLDEAGNVLLHHHHAFLAEVRAKEEQSGAATFDEEPLDPAPLQPIFKGELQPGPHDVVLRRGLRGSRYSGNIRFRELVHEHFGLYDGAPLADRKAAVQAVFDALKANGARFLTFGDHGEGVELDEEEVKNRISHAFRNEKIKRKKLKSQLK